MDVSPSRAVDPQFFLVGTIDGQVMSFVCGTLTTASTLTDESMDTHEANGRMPLVAGPASKRGKPRRSAADAAVDSGRLGQRLGSGVRVNATRVPLKISAPQRAGAGHGLAEESADTGGEGGLTA